MSNVFDRVTQHLDAMGKNTSMSNTKEEGKPIKKSEAFLNSLKKLGFNMEELENVIKVKGSQLILSIAGSGKTTGLNFKVEYDVLTGELTKVVNVNGNDVRVLDRVWICTFLNTGAEELKTRLRYWQRKLGLLDTTEYMAFSTLHAEFKRALTAMGVKTDIIDSSLNDKILRSILSKYSIEYEGKPLNSDMFNDLKGALTYSRNRLDEKKYVRDIYKDLEILPTMLDVILAEWKQGRVEVGKLDFEDLQEILYNECVVKGNLDVINFIRNRYKYIYIDEFQDTSQIQYAVLKVYASGANKVVAIGDDDQTIYSWRGSDNNIITKEFIKDFNPTISKLTVNYRCPSVILNAIKPSIELNENRFEKALRASKPGGRLRVGGYNDYISMVYDLCNLVQEDVIKGKSVAILCRVNSDGLLPAILLDRIGGFQYSISGDGMTLDSHIGRSMINIAKLFTDRSTLAVRNTLNSLTWDKFSINRLLSVCSNNKVSFWKISDEDLRHSCPAIAEILIRWKKWRKSYGDIESLRMIYFYFRTNVYVKNTQYSEVCRSVISTMETLLSVTKCKNVESFIEELEDINERLKARKKAHNKYNIRVATVHEFKGKEADSVYVWNDSLDVFPYKDCDMGNVEEFSEERRVHYIACTRAKEINTILYQNNCEGLFLQEMDLSNAERLNTEEVELDKSKLGGTGEVDLEDLADDFEFVIPGKE